LGHAAHAFYAASRVTEAQQALQTAIGLTEDDATRVYLRGVATPWQTNR